MAESRTVESLTGKRDEIIRIIDAYEAKLGQAQADLSHLNAVLALFKHNPDQMMDYKPYAETNRLFRYGELTKLLNEVIGDCKLTTGEVAKAIMVRKGLDTQDRVLLKTLSYRVMHLLSSMVKRGKVTSVPYHRVKGRAPTRMWEFVKKSNS